MITEYMYEFMNSCLGTPQIIVYSVGSVSAMLLIITASLITIICITLCVKRRSKDNSHGKYN